MSDKYDFNEIIDRRGTSSLKYDFTAERGRTDDVLPLWVADMDFRSPPSVIAAIATLSKHGIFGYSDTKEDYFNAVISWFNRRFDWNCSTEWLVKTPGVVTALALSVRAFTSPGDAVMIQPPVYYPFYSVITDNDRRVAENPLLFKNGRYQMDFESMESRIVSENVKMFILCSPHNPVGRVWTEMELKTLGEICRRNNVIVISDEIHCDIIRNGYRHSIFSCIVPEMDDMTVLCTAPSKTFNIAGLQISNIFIKNPKLRSAFLKELNRFGYSQANQAGIAACAAAYKDGEEWLEALLVYLEGNYRFIRSYLKSELPEIRLVESEGTYFAWLDCSGLGLTDHELNTLISDRAKLWLDAGRIFGLKTGKGFQRMVYACPRVILEDALDRLAKAVRNST